jgi:hypothetical protein
VPPGKEEGGALLRNQPPVSEEGEHLVPEEELGSVFIDVRNGNPFAIGCLHASGDDGVDVRIPF